MENYIFLDGRKIPLSEETARSLRGYIPCPIMMEGIGGRLGIPFNDNRQVLFYDYRHGIYNVLSCNEDALIPCDLIPCKREDLETGDVAFRTDNGYGNALSHELEDAYSYCLILDDKEYCYPDDDGGVKGLGYYWEYWYKVVPR